MPVTADVLLRQCGFPVRFLGNRRDIQQRLLHTRPGSSFFSVCPQLFTLLTHPAFGLFVRIENLTDTVFIFAQSLLVKFLIQENPANLPPCHGIIAALTKRLRHCILFLFFFLFHDWLRRGSRIRSLRRLIYARIRYVKIMLQLFP